MSPDPVVIVGAGPGIGLATARRFGREGYPLALVARDGAQLDALVAELAAEGVSAIGVVADIADAATIGPAFARIRDTLGDPGVLVMNASQSVRGKATELDLDELAASLSSNIVGPLACVQQVVPAMRAAGRGTVLLTGGGLALNPFPDWTTAALGKAGQRSLWQSLAKELEPDGIHAAMVTVNGFVKLGTALAPELIADAHYALHRQDREAWEREVTLVAEPG